MQRKECFTERSRNGNPVLDAVFLQARKLPLRHADGNGVTVTLCVRTAHTHSPPFVLLCNKCNRKILGCQENTPHILCSLVLASDFFCFDWMLPLRTLLGSSVRTAYPALLRTPCPLWSALCRGRGFSEILRLLWGSSCFLLLTLAESSPFWYNRFRKGRLPPWWCRFSFRDVDKLSA